MLIPDLSAIPITIRSPIGDLDLNTVLADGTKYQIVKEGSRVAASVRATVDNIPQASGEIHHPRAQEGVGMRVQLEFYENDGASRACAAVQQAMCDTLMGHLWQLLNADDGRVLWTPAGKAQRMLTQARWLEGVSPEWAGDMLRVAFAIDSPFPYAITAEQEAVDVTSATTIPNDGNTEFFPVLQLQGPFTNATITNTSSVDDNGDPLQIVYDGSRPGASAIGSGDILEIDTFQNKAYLGIGGPPGDDANRKAGIDVSASDFFSMLPGDNDITTDVDVRFLVNDAWAA